MGASSCLVRWSCYQASTIFNSEQYSESETAVLTNLSNKSAVDQKAIAG